MAYVFAVAALTGSTPRELIEKMLEAVPTDEAWNETGLEELLGDLYGDM